MIRLVPFFGQRFRFGWHGSAPNDPFVCGDATGQRGTLTRRGMALCGPVLLRPETCSWGR